MKKLQLTTSRKIISHTIQPFSKLKKIEYFYPDIIKGCQITVAAN